MNCPQCAGDFTPKRKEQRFCSPECSQQAQSRGDDDIKTIRKLLSDNGVDPKEIAAITQVKFSEWQGLTKDEDGEPVITGLKGASIVLTPKWAAGPEWPLVQQAKPTIIKPRAVPKKSGDYMVAVILPDPQIGFRQFEDGTLDPFHDERALDVAMQVIAQVQPDLIVNLGDLVDLPAFGRYAQEPAFAHTTQASLDRAHRFLAQQRATAPAAEIRLLQGNHDVRIQDYIIANAKAAFALRRADTPDSWPVMSLPYLLRLDDLDVNYVEGYPAGRTWINDRLACQHAPSKLRSSSSSAAASIDDERVSVIFGHTHRIESAYKTRSTREGPKVYFSASPGCLCRIDGAVPSTKGAIDVSGKPVTTTENWQGGMGIVNYMPGDGAFAYEQVFIYDGKAVFRGREIACAA